MQNRSNKTRPKHFLEQNSIKICRKKLAINATESIKHLVIKLKNFINTLTTSKNKTSIGKSINLKVFEKINMKLNDISSNDLPVTKKQISSFKSLSKDSKILKELKIKDYVGKIKTKKKHTSSNSLTKDSKILNDLKLNRKSSSDLFETKYQKYNSKSLI